MVRKRVKTARYSWLKRAFVWLGGALAILWLASTLLMINFYYKHRFEPEVIGVSFSQKQAERYGVDWKRNYSALLKDLEFKHLRIAAYWDRIEPRPGEYDFSELDWMVAEAAKTGAKLTVVVGQKNIRYPECYYPAWVNKEDVNSTSKQAKAMVGAVVGRYKDDAAIEAWQVENEFLLHSFGECPAQNLTRQQLKDEIAVVRGLDPNRPIVLTQSDQFGFPVFGPFADYFGFSMYRWSYREGFG